jgi:uncharacterized membrane protein (UPF0127 family)
MWCRFLFVLRIAASPRYVTGAMPSPKPLLLPAVLLAVLAALACGRSAPEELPSATAAPPIPKLSTPVSAAAGPAGQEAARLDAARCVHPTPDAPPPPVAPGPAPGCPPDDEKSPPKLPLVQITFPETVVEAELARGRHDTTRGLMFRKSMAETHGMLFDLDVRSAHEFWMHNTCIPLDLLYIDEDGLIVGIVENAPTLNDDTRGVECESRYVLEVNAGWSRRHHVKAGLRIAIPPEVTAYRKTD